MPTVMNFDNDPAYKQMIEGISGTVQMAVSYAQWPLNKALCQGIRQTISDLLEPSGSVDGLHKVETGLLLATEYAKALNQKLEEACPRASKQLIYDIVRETLTISAGMEQSMPKLDELMNTCHEGARSRYKEITGRYVPDILGYLDAMDKTVETKLMQHPLKTSAAVAMRFT